MLQSADFSTARYAPDKGSEEFTEFFFDHVLPMAGPDGVDRMFAHARRDSDIDGLSPYTIIRLLAANPTAQDLPVTWQFADVAEGG
ncbi:hypothetical protein ACRAWD_05350 [Caulobacter segnis]